MFGSVKFSCVHNTELYLYYIYTCIVIQHVKGYTLLQSDSEIYVQVVGLESVVMASVLKQ